jgi:hypothetical protein
MRKRATSNNTPSVSNAELSHLKANTCLRVVVAYRDVDHERLGKTYWESLSRQLEWRDSPAVTDWKFEMLACPSLGGIAAAEAREARLVVLATDSADGLPDAVKSWVLQWSSVRLPERAVLVVLLSENAGCPGALWPDFSYLEEKMKMCGREFFVYATGSSADDGGTFCVAEATKVLGMGRVAPGELKEVACVLAMADTEESGGRVPNTRHGRCK